MELVTEAPPFDVKRPSDLGRLRVTLFLVTTSLIGVFQGISNILLPRVVEQLDPAGKVRDLAMLTTLAAILTVFGLVAGGSISDRTRSRWGRRTPTMVVTLLLGICLMIALGLAQSIGAMMVLMPLVWLALNSFQAALFAMLPDRVPLADRGKASAAIAMGTPVGLFLGVNLAATLPSTFLGYVALAGMLLLGTASVILFSPEAPALDPYEPKAKGDGARAMFSAFRSRNFTLTFVSRALLFVSFFSVTGYLFYLLQDYVGVANLPGHDAGQGVSRLYSLITIAWLIVTPITGYLADRVSHTPIIVGVTSILIGVAITAPSLSPSWTAMLVFAIGSGAAFGIYFAIDLKLMSLVLPDPETAGRDLGLLGIATAGPQIITPAIAAGLIAVGGYQTLFAVGALLAMAGGVAALFIRLAR